MVIKQLEENSVFFLIKEYKISKFFWFYKVIIFHRFLYKIKYSMKQENKIIRTNNCLYLLSKSKF